MTFVSKAKDYGTAWRILRTTSITDQLFIKARRIRNIEELGKQKVSDSVLAEYIGLINYSVMALIQLSLPADTPQELASEDAGTLYDAFIDSRTRRIDLEASSLFAFQSDDPGQPVYVGLSGLDPKRVDPDLLRRIREILIRELRSIRDLPAFLRVRRMGCRRLCKAK